MVSRGRCNTSDASGSCFVAGAVPCALWTSVFKTIHILNVHFSLCTQHVPAHPSYDFGRVGSLPFWRVRTTVSALCARASALFVEQCEFRHGSRKPLGTLCVEELFQQFPTPESARTPVRTACTEFLAGSIIQLDTQLASKQGTPPTVKPPFNARVR